MEGSIKMAERSARLGGLIEPVPVILVACVAAPAAKVATLGSKLPTTGNADIYIILSTMTAVTLFLIMLRFVFCFKLFAFK
ncbi:hypothetical protein D3C72_2383420 [compost metagenome]